MTFNETCLYIQDLSDAFDLSSAKMDVLIEGVYRNLEVEYKEAELQVIEESGTEEDLLLLKEGANQNFAQKTSNAIKKTFENLKNFIKEIIQKIKDFFNNAENKLKLNKIKKMVDKKKKKKNEKIDIPDVHKQNNIFDKMISKVQINLIKMRNLARDPSNANVDKMNKMYDKDSEEYVTSKNVAKVAFVTVTIAAAIALFAELAKDIENTDAGIDFSEYCPDNMDNSEASKCFGKEALLGANIIKAKVSNKVSMLKDIFTKISNIIHDPDHKGENTVIPTEEISDMMRRNSIDESYNDLSFMDEDAYLESVENEIFGTDDDHVSSYLESVEDSLNTVDVDAYLESVEDELTFDPESYLESVEDELFSDDNYTEATDDYLDNLEKQLDYLY